MPPDPFSRALDLVGTGDWQRSFQQQPAKERGWIDPQVLPHNGDDILTVAPHSQIGIAWSGVKQLQVAARPPQELGELWAAQREVQARLDGFRHKPPDWRDRDAILEHVVDEAQMGHIRRRLDQLEPTWDSAQGPWQDALEHWNVRTWPPVANAIQHLISMQELAHQEATDRPYAHDWRTAYFEACRDLEAVISVLDRYQQHWVQQHADRLRQDAERQRTASTVAA
jgi:hypothetical protein